MSLPSPKGSDGTAVKGPTTFMSRFDEDNHNPYCPPDVERIEPETHPSDKFIDALIIVAACGVGAVFVLFIYLLFQ